MMYLYFTHKQHTEMINLIHTFDRTNRSRLPHGLPTAGARSAEPSSPAAVGRAPGVSRHTPQMIPVLFMGEAFDDGLQIIGVFGSSLRTFDLLEARR